MEKTELDRIRLVERMLEKQDELNIQTNGSDWKKNSKLKWYRAIWVESAELINYTNWEWWKLCPESIRDAQMELIDIWHFFLSDLLTNTNIISPTTITTIFDLQAPQFDDHDFYLEAIRLETENLVKSCLSYRPIESLYTFVTLCKLLDLNLEKLYKLYIGKNVLNKFRQNNGYKQKTYKKIWDGKEDNVYLMNEIDRLEIDNTFESQVYNILENKYKTL